MADSETPVQNPQASGASWSSFIKVCLQFTDTTRVTACMCQAWLCDGCYVLCSFCKATGPSFTNVRAYL